MPGSSNVTVFENGPIRGKRCRYGLMAFNRLDTHVGRSLDSYGQWAQSEVEAIRPFLSAGDYVIDVGANVGTHSLFLSEAVGPSGCVVAFEPQRLVYQLLCANLAINAIQNVFAFNMACGERRGTARLPVVNYGRPANFGGVKVQTEGSGQMIDVVPLDSVATGRCSLVKIDVEGMELSVLQGADQLLRRERPTLFVENNDPERSPALIRHLSRLGYLLFWQFSSFFEPDNFFENRVNVLGDICDANMLCVRPEQRGLVGSLLAVDDPEESPEAAFARHLASTPR